MKPERARGLELADRHRFERAAVDLALVRGVVERQAEQRRDERRQPNRRRDPVVEHEQLQQQRRAAHQLDVARERRRGSADRRRPARSAIGTPSATASAIARHESTIVTTDGTQQRRQIAPRRLPFATASRRSSVS